MDVANGGLRAIIPLILSSVFCNAMAQILLKKAMSVIGPVSLTLSSVLPKLLPIIFNPYIIAGLCSYVVSLGLWLLVLSRAEVSMAYPFLSIGYIIVAIAGALLFNESLTFIRMAGIAFICVGVVMIASK